MRKPATTTAHNKAPKPAGRKSSAAQRGGGGGKPKNMKHNNAATAAAVANCGKQQQGLLKVVHISNPMKVVASPAEFRSLVQDLTGLHAAEWPDHPRWRAVSSFTPENGNTANDQQVPTPGASGGGTHEAEDPDLHHGGLDLDNLGVGKPCCFGSDLSYDGHDQMVVNTDDDDFSSFYAYS